MVDIRIADLEQLKLPKGLDFQNAKGAYNHATSNFAIYSNETSQDKLPEA